MWPRQGKIRDGFRLYALLQHLFGQILSRDSNRNGNCAPLPNFILQNPQRFLHGMHNEIHQCIAHRAPLHSGFRRGHQRCNARDIRSNHHRIGCGLLALFRQFTGKEQETTQSPLLIERKAAAE